MCLSVFVYNPQIELDFQPAFNIYKFSYLLCHFISSELPTNIFIRTSIIVIMVIINLRYCIALYCGRAPAANAPGCNAA